MTKCEVPSWLPLALIMLVLGALFHRLFSGQTLFWGLPTLQFDPWRQWAFEELRAGHLPAWNPYLGAGAPLLANYQTAVFYPPNWLSLILSDPQAMSLVAVLHVVWAGLGMWLFAGELGLPSFGRGISTLAYALSGYLIARLGSFPTADTGAWLPWIFWLTGRIMTRRRWPDVGGLALIFALQLLAGHAQTVWYNSVGVGLYVLWVLAWNQRRDPLRQRAGAVLMVSAGLLLGLATAAVQVIPTAEYLAESQRSSGLDYKTATNLSYHPARLITLLSPNFYGTPADGSYITQGIYFEDAAYIGFIPFISACAAVIGWLRKRRSLAEHPTFITVPFWVMLALLALFFALGKYNPVFHFLYDHVPTFKTFREPVRWLILSEFSLAMLAGIGTGHWGRGKWVVFWSRLAAAGGGAMAVMALVGLDYVKFDSENLRVLSWGMVVLGCWIAGAALLTLIQPVDPSPISPHVWQTVVLVFVALDLAWLADGLNPTVPAKFFQQRAVAPPPGRTYWFKEYRNDITFGTDKDAPVQVEGYFDLTDYRKAVKNWQVIRASLLPNINMLDRVPSLNNNDPLLPSYHSQYLDLIEEEGKNAGALLRAAGVSQAYGQVPIGWQGENPATAPASGGVTLAWLVPHAEWHDSDSAIKAALRDPAWNPEQTVILAGKSAALVGQAYPVGTGQVTLLENHPERRRYHVTASSASTLVISETWYPGWSVTVNGKPAPLYRANLAFQAVAVPAGESDVTLTYRLNYWTVSAVISLMALLAAVGLIMFEHMKRLNRKNDEHA